MEIKPVAAYLKGWKETLEKRSENPRLPLTSLPTLSRKIHGIPEGKMTVIGARTSMGKTTLAMQMIMDLASIGAPVIYLSFEMKPNELMDRMFCNRYRIDNFELVKGKIGNYPAEADDFFKWAKNIRLVFADDFARSWKELDKFLLDLPVKPRVILLDYIQAIAHDTQYDKKFIDDYILNFRQLAVREDFAGIIVSQINRTAPDAKSKEPQLHQLKGSGFLEEHADLVMLLDWRDKDKPDYTINVAKNRGGPTGYIKLKYFPHHYRFEEEKQEKQEEIKEIRVDWNN